MDDRSDRERRLDSLYVAVRDAAAVDRQAAFDIAMNELQYFPLHAEARELAEASVADDDETRLASAAAAFLEADGYEPGFEQAPERFGRLERALDAVRADMRATGLTGEVRLVRPDWTPNAAVETWAGDTGWTGGIFFSDTADDLSALVAVAEQARQAIMESLGYQSTGTVWPACPAHGLETLPEARNGTGVWWCDGGNGHVSAEIGHWAARQQSRLWRIPCLPGGITRCPGAAGLRRQGREKRLTHTTDLVHRSTTARGANPQVRELTSVRLRDADKTRVLGRRRRACRKHRLGHGLPRPYLSSCCAR